jgi:hypothetical protein
MVRLWSMAALQRFSLAMARFTCSGAVSLLPLCSGQATSRSKLAHWRTQSTRGLVTRATSIWLTSVSTMQRHCSLYREIRFVAQRQKAH